jgi:hypothetical protein
LIRTDNLAAVEANQEYVRSVAFHEAAHVVVAAAQDLPLSDKGIRLDRLGNGNAHYRDRKPDGSRDIGSESEREKTIISTFAGWIAQNKVHPCGQGGAFYDINQANALLDEMYPGQGSMWWAARRALTMESERLVRFHWPAIEAVALALWSKPYSRREQIPGDWSSEAFEKYLTVGEIVVLLQQFDIRPTLRVD